MKNNSDVLNICFKICNNIIYEVNKEGIVTVYEKQNHIIQRFFRKLKFKIPMYKEITLDEYGSEAFIQIDGKKTVEDIGKILESRFGENVYPLYDRLLIFLNHLYVNCEYIEKIN